MISWNLRCLEYDIAWPFFAVLTLTNSNLLTSGNASGLSHTQSTLLLCEAAYSSAIVQETLYLKFLVSFVQKMWNYPAKYLSIRFLYPPFRRVLLDCYIQFSLSFRKPLLLIYLFTTVMLLRDSCETRRADQILNECSQQSKEEYYFLEQTDECYVSSREDRSMQSNSLLSAQRLHKRSSCSLSCSHLYVDPSVTKIPSALNFKSSNASVRNY